MAKWPNRSGAVEFARVGGKVAVIRLVGRCSLQNSAGLAKAAEICDREMEGCGYVVDFKRCSAVDSTFLGALAGMALRQRREGRGTLIAVNVSPPLCRTMMLLGLTHILRIEDAAPQNHPDHEVQITEADRVELSRAEHVAHMIQAHERLIEVDSGNEVRFVDVLKYLEDSLVRAQAAERRQSSPANE